jgi:hypothetical protein
MLAKLLAFSHTLGRDLPDADVCRRLDRELALSAYVVEKLLN